MFPFGSGRRLSGYRKQREWALAELLAGRGLDPSTIVLPAFDENYELVAGTAESKGRIAERIDDRALERDWHSDYAVFILRLADRLEETTDPNRRVGLIARLQESLDQAGPGN